MEDKSIDLSRLQGINRYGHKGVLDPSLFPQASSDAGFFGQISGNPFFTAVS